MLLKFAKLTLNPSTCTIFIPTCIQQIFLQREFQRMVLIKWKFICMYFVKSIHMMTYGYIFFRQITVELFLQNYLFKKNQIQVHVQFVYILQISIHDSFIYSHLLKFLCMSWQVQVNLDKWTAYYKDIGHAKLTAEDREVVVLLESLRPADVETFAEQQSHVSLNKSFHVSWCAFSFLNAIWLKSCFCTLVCICMY